MADRIPASSFSPLFKLERDEEWRLCPIHILGPVAQDGDWAAKRFADKLGEVIGVSDVVSVISLVSELMAADEGVPDAARRWQSALKRTMGQCLLADLSFASFLLLGAGHRDIDKLVMISSSRGIVSQVVRGELVGCKLQSVLDKAQDNRLLVDLRTQPFDDFDDIIDGEIVPAIIPAYYVHFRDGHAIFRILGNRDTNESKGKAPRELVREITIEDPSVVEFLIRASLPPEEGHF